MRHFYMLAGWLAFGLGLIGIVLPLLPTVPFMLLAAFCWARSSDRFHDWLTGHPRFGPAIQDWREGGAIRPRAKRAAMVAIAFSFVLSFLLGAAAVVIAIQALVLACVSVFILTRPDGSDLRGSGSRESR